MIDYLRKMSYTSYGLLGPEILPAFLFLLFTLTACRPQANPISTTELPNTPLFRDEFSRPNTLPGSLGTAPDGLPYQMSGVGMPTAQINNRQFVSTSPDGPTYVSKYFAAKTIRQITITFQFTQPPSTVNGLALITSTDSSGINLTNMNHWVFTGSGQTGATIWYRGEQNLLPQFATRVNTQTYVMGKLYTISLTIDDEWVHCQLPDGSIVDEYDPRLPLVAGRRVIWEIGAGIAVTRHEVY